MSVVEEIRKLLEKEYGIKNDADLNLAIKKMAKPNITVFVAPRQTRK